LRSNNHSPLKSGSIETNGDSEVNAFYRAVSDELGGGSHDPMDFESQVELLKSEFLLHRNEWSLLSSYENERAFGLAEFIANCRQVFEENGPSLELPAMCAWPETHVRGISGLNDVLNWILRAQTDYGRRLHPRELQQYDLWIKPLLKARTGQDVSELVRRIFNVPVTFTNDGRCRDLWELRHAARTDKALKPRIKKRADRQAKMGRPKIYKLWPEAHKRQVWRTPLHFYQELCDDLRLSVQLCEQINQKCCELYPGEVENSYPVVDRLLLELLWDMAEDVAELARVVHVERTSASTDNDASDSQIADADEDVNGGIFEECFDSEESTDFESWGWSADHSAASREVPVSILERCMNCYRVTDQDQNLHVVSADDLVGASRYISDLTHNEPLCIEYLGKSGTITESMLNTGTLPKSYTNSFQMKLNLLPAPSSELFVQALVYRKRGKNDPDFLGFHQFVLGPDTLGFPLYMSDTVVTRGQWMAVMGTEPWRIENVRTDLTDEEIQCLPATHVSLRQAREFCERLGQLEGLHYRLPNDDEWRHACTAGRGSAYCHGDSVLDLNDYAWFGENSEDRLQPVRQKFANRFGLYDMHGNVWEWCSPVDVAPYFSAYQDAETAHTPPESPIIRGGCWLSNAESCAATFQNASDDLSSEGRAIIGFRVVLQSQDNF
jgi:sulfatase modifying factor 1